MKNPLFSKKFTLAFAAIILSSFIVGGCQDKALTQPSVQPSNTTEINQPTLNTTSEQTQQTISNSSEINSTALAKIPGEMDIYNGDYKINFTIPTSWIKSGEYNFKKGNDELIFDPDYTPYRPRDTGIQEKDIQTNDQKTLHITQYNMDAGLFMVIKDAKDKNKESHFEFYYVSDDKNIDSDLNDILKSVKWEKNETQPQNTQEKKPDNNGNLSNFQDYAGKEIALKFQYPKNFFMKTVDGSKGFYGFSGPTISIQSTDKNMSVNKMNEPEINGLQILIEKMRPAESNLPEDLKATSNPALKVVDFEKIKEEMKNTRITHAVTFPQAEYFYFGQKSRYSIIVYQKNFQGDYQKIVDGILNSLKE